MHKFLFASRRCSACGSRVMSYDPAREIIGCLRVSGSSGAHAERLLRFGLRGRKSTLRCLEEAGRALEWRRLEELGIASVLPAELRATLERHLHDHQRRIAEMAGEFEAINLVLESAGVKYVALKGFALIPDYCPCVSFRSACDCGYLMLRGELERARRALEAAHYGLRPGTVGEPLVYFHEAPPPRRPFQLAHTFRHTRQDGCRLASGLDIACFVELAPPPPASGNASLNGGLAHRSARSPD